MIIVEQKGVDLNIFFTHLFFWKNQFFPRKLWEIIFVRYIYFQEEGGI